MGFGSKKKIRQQLIGVKRGIHRASKFGSKTLTVGEVLFPEVAAELELTKLVLNKVSSLTKDKRGKSKMKVSNDEFSHKTVNHDLKDVTSKKSFGDKNTNVNGF